MNSIQLALIPLLIIALSASAESAEANKTADSEWSRVIGLTTPSNPAFTPGAKKTPTQLAAEKNEKAQSARQAAEAAKAFHTTYPTHVAAADARKLEVISALRGITDADKSQEQAALQGAKLFREDKNNSTTSRFEVALLAERVATRSRLGNRVDGNNPAELEKIGDRLRVEFGDIPEVFRFYVSVARGADMTSAVALANKMLQSPADEDTKAEARAIVARHALVNKPLNWNLAEVDKKEPLKPSQLGGKPTLIYVSSYADTGRSLQGLARFKKNLPSNHQVVYLSLGATEDQARLLKATAPVAGLHCFEARGIVGPSAEQFHLRHTPYVFVLDRSGSVAGYGPLAELPNLIGLTNR